MDRPRIFLIVLLLALPVVAPACMRTSVLDTRMIRGWAAEQGYQLVEGPDEIRTEQQFFDYIDGAAQPIIDLGWKRSLFGVLKKDETHLRLTVHAMRNPKAAVAFFDQNVFKDTQPISVGERAFYWDRGAFSKGILFQKGSVVCELTQEKKGNRDSLLRLASSLETRIK